MTHSGWSRLRQRFPPAQLCLIALGGYAGMDMRDACLAEGFDGYLVKPGKFASWNDSSEATARTLARRSADPHAREGESRFLMHPQADDDLTISGFNGTRMPRCVLYWKAGVGRLCRTEPRSPSGAKSP